MKQGISLAAWPVMPARTFRYLILLTAFAVSWVSAAEIWVDSEADGIEPSSCTLRAAIESVNTNSAIGGCVTGEGFWQIRLAEGIESIALTQGPLQINGSLEISHADMASWTLDGMSNGRVLNIDTDGYVGLHGARIIGGLADSGAGIRIDGGPYVHLHEVDLDGNLAATGGGAIELLSGMVHLTESTIRNNQAEIGGGLYMQQGQAFIESTQIHGNQAEQGGGIAIDWVITGNVPFIPLEMMDTTITGNHATDGGGLYLTASNDFDSFVLENLVIQQNTASRHGGGIALSGTSASLRESLIEGNQVLIEGEAYEDSGGGGIAFMNSGVLDIWMSVIRANSAPRGGGIHVDQGDRQGMIVLGSSQVTDNHAAFNGGGVDLEGGGLWTYDSQIDLNSAQAGGGVFAFNAQLDFFSSHIEHNQAAHGGGLAIAGDPETASSMMQLQMESSLIRNNQADIGGGVYFDVFSAQGGVMQLLGLQLLDNQAMQLGGGMAIIEGNVQVEDLLAQGNSVTGSREDGPCGGGGVAVTSPGSGFFDRVQLLDNTAPAGGGLLLDPRDGLDSAHVILAESEISGNSGDIGGGIAVRGGGFFAWDGEIQQNQADIGGGVDVTGGFLGLDHVTLAGNSAVMGGGISVRPSEAPQGGDSLMLWASPVINNLAEIGGGIYLEMASQPGNQPFRLTELHVEGNVASSRGGGIAFVGGHFELSDSVILANVAAEEGGGLHFSGPSSDLNTILHGQIELNSAQRGGGIAAQEQHLLILETSIEENTAGLPGRARGESDGLGGGLWIVGGDTWLIDSFITNNQAEVSGGGLYLRDGAGLINQSRVIGNSGGGVDAAGGMLMVEHSAISTNVGGRVGGLRCAECDQMDVYHSSITDNQGEYFGGIESSSGFPRLGRGQHGSPFTMSNVTVSGNAGAQVGGIMAENARIDHSTIAFNQRTSADPAHSGGLNAPAAGGLAASNVVMISNSIIAANQAPVSPADLAVHDPKGQPGFADLSYSLIQDESGFIAQGQGNRFGLDPGLLPLAPNGATNTLTHALMASSPAIHNGDPNFLPPPHYDQRGYGFPRLFGTRIDIGAFESMLAPAMQLSSETLDFGAVRINQTGELMTAEVSNVGDGALSIGDVVLADDGGGLFELVEDDCSNRILVPGASCELLVEFAPDQAGNFSGTLSIEGNSDPAPGLISLEGQGVTAEIQVMPQSLDFGNLVAGHGNAVRAVSIDNTGDLAVVVESIDGASEPFEVVHGECPEPPFDLQPGESCLASIHFTPTLIDVFEQTIIVTSDADNGPHFIAVSGAGVDGLLFQSRFEH